MKRKVCLLLVLATLVAGGAFAQKVGDTVDVFGKNYTVKEVKDGNVLLQPTPTLNGDWKLGAVTININGANGVIKQFGSLTGLAKSAVDKGYHKIGTVFFRNLKKTGDLTWTGQYLGIAYNTNAPNVAIGTNWENVTLTLSADGKTLLDSATGFTYTRQ